MKIEVHNMNHITIISRVANSVWIWMKYLQLNVCVLPMRSSKDVDLRRGAMLFGCENRSLNAHVIVTIWIFILFIISDLTPRITVKKKQHDSIICAVSFCGSSENNFRINPNNFGMFIASSFLLLSQKHERFVGENST